MKNLSDYIKKSYNNYKKIDDIIIENELQLHFYAEFIVGDCSYNEIYERYGSYLGQKELILDLAKEKGIEVRYYDVIYKLLEDIEAAMKGMLDPEYEEVVIGEAEVRQLFHFSKVGNIAGSHVTSGIIKVGTPCRVIRDGIVVTTSKIATLQREKDQAREVKSGFDCGMTIDSFPDIKEGDIIEAYEVKEVKNI